MLKELKDDPAFEILPSLIIGVFIFVVFLLYFFQESDESKKSQWHAYHRQSYHGLIKEKKFSGRGQTHVLILKSGLEFEINRDAFQKVSVGDSVYKRGYSDSVFLYTKYYGTVVVDLFKVNQSLK